MAHLHSVYDSDMHFSIDPITRVIRSESPKKSIVQYSHNSERFTFDLPRYIEEHDMSLCNRVEIHFINIGTGGEQNKDVYEVDDWQNSPDDDSVVIGSWLISRNATQLAGALVFLLRCACIADDGTVEYDWYTEIYSDFSISNGMNNGDAVAAIFPDVLEAWRREIYANFEVGFEIEKNAAVSAIEAKGAEVLETIPDDYTAMSERVDQLSEAIGDLDSVGFERYTGHNIIPINELKGGTINGVTIGIDKYTGIVTVKGTCTTTGAFDLVPKNEKTYFSLISGNKYNVHSKAVTGGSVILMLATNNENLYQGTNEISISPTENKDITRIALYFIAGNTYDAELYLYCAMMDDWDEGITGYVTYPKNLPANVYVDVAEDAFNSAFNRFTVISSNSAYYNEALIFDTATKVCTVNPGNIISGKSIMGVLKKASKVTLTDVDGIIVYDTETNAVYAITRNTSPKKTELILAVYNDFGKKVSTINHYSVNGFDYGIDYTSHKTQSPNYEYHALNGASWWSDFTFIGGELWVFCASGDETHTLKNGKIQIFNPTTGEKLTEYMHNFGHCNTVHYNPDTDKLLIANLPGNETYPSALYIFNNVSGWRNKTFGSTIDFATESPSIIDVSSLGTAAKNTVACWGENNMSKHNIVYVSGNYNAAWWKILLGTGTNQLENGTYTEAAPGEFNGTFNVIWQKGFERRYDAKTEVIQGIDYDGIIRTSNGHNELQWWDWKPSDKGMTREENCVIPYNDDGSTNYCVSEGYAIKDGYAYVGCIFSNSAHTSGTGECGYIKVKLTD